MSREFGDSDIHFTALTRYCERVGSLGFLSDTWLSGNRLWLTPRLRCVKHWKVLIAPPRRTMRIKLMEFCHSICHYHIKSIEVVIISLGDATHPRSDHWIDVESDSGWLRYDWNEKCFADSPTTENMQEVLFPLEMLRSIGRVCIREAKLNEMPDFFYSTRIPKRTTLTPRPSTGMFPFSSSLCCHVQLINHILSH